MKQQFKKFLSIFLLTALSVFILPKDLLHELHHHDTVDNVNYEGVQISEIHHHCISLELSSPPFVHQVAFYEVVLSVVPVVFKIPKEQIYHTQTQTHTDLRGPPALVL